MVWSIINHPFGGTPMAMETPIWPAELAGNVTLDPGQLGAQDATGHGWSVDMTCGTEATNEYGITERFPYMGDPQNGWFIMGNPSINGWFRGTPYFGILVYPGYWWVFGPCIVYFTRTIMWVFEHAVETSICGDLNGQHDFPNHSSVGNPIVRQTASCCSWFCFTCFRSFFEKL